MSRAHFYADAVREVFIELPKEDPRAGDRDTVGKLEKTMYGSLDAAERWGLHYAARLTEAGYEQGAASPCHFYHPREKVAVVVHGDDFIAVGRRRGLAHLKKVLEASYEIKDKIFGPDAHKGEEQEVRVLGRVLTWNNWGIQMEGDPGHQELVVQQLGLETSNAVSTPGEEDEAGEPAAAVLARRRLAEQYEEPWRSEDEEEVLQKDEAKHYASVAARGNYMAQDRPDLMFSA